MDDAFNLRILLEDGLSGFLVAQVHLLKGRTDARDFLNAVEYFNLRVRQIVDNNNFVACLLQFYGGVRTDETGSACNKNCLLHFLIDSFVITDFSECKVTNK